MRIRGSRIQESGVAGVAEYAEQGLYPKNPGAAFPGKIFAKLPDSLAPELLQLLTPEFLSQVDLSVEEDDYKELAHALTGIPFAIPASTTLPVIKSR
jgi:hypothetical protein